MNDLDTMEALVRLAERGREHLTAVTRAEFRLLHRATYSDLVRDRACFEIIRLRIEAEDRLKRLLNATDDLMHGITPRCVTCGGTPPTGFACLTCGAAA